MFNHIEKHTKMVNSKLTPFTDERRLVEPESYTKSRHDDDVKWMISFAFSKEVQPMWVQTQEIFYLPQINQSPTSTAVFAETLKRALKFADHFLKRKCYSYV